MMGNMRSLLQFCIHHVSSSTQREFVVSVWLEFVQPNSSRSLCCEKNRMLFPLSFKLSTTDERQTEVLNIQIWLVTYSCAHSTNKHMNWTEPGRAFFILLLNINVFHIFVCRGLRGVSELLSSWGLRPQHVQPSAGPLLRYLKEHSSGFRGVRMARFHTFTHNFYYFNRGHVQNKFYTRVSYIANLHPITEPCPPS